MDLPAGKQSWGSRRLQRAKPRISVLQPGSYKHVESATILSPLINQLQLKAWGAQLSPSLSLTSLLPQGLQRFICKKFIFCAIPIYSRRLWQNRQIYRVRFSIYRGFSGLSSPGSSRYWILE